MSSASTAPTNLARPPVPPTTPALAPTGADGTDAPDALLQRQWLVVRSGASLFGIPVAQVREVVRPDGLMPVPGTPHLQAGIVNVRGAIVTVLDLQALRTGVRAVAPGSIVLIEHGARPVGVTVDAVHDVRVAAGDPAASDIAPLDAAALVAAHLHSDGERDR